MPRKSCYDRLEECYERAVKRVTLEDQIQHLSENTGTFIGVITPTKLVSHGSERLFYVCEDGALIPRERAPNQLNEFQ